MEKQMGYVQCKINKKALQPISSNIEGLPNIVLSPIMHKYYPTMLMTFLNESKACMLSCRPRKYMN